MGTRTLRLAPARTVGKGALTAAPLLSLEAGSVVRFVSETRTYSQLVTSRKPNYSDGAYVGILPSVSEATLVGLIRTLLLGALGHFGVHDVPYRVHPTVRRNPVDWHVVGAAGVQATSCKSAAALCGKLR